MKRFFEIILAVILALGLTACQDIGEPKKPDADPTDYPVEIGSLVFDEAPAAVASLSPALTEIICDLGFKDRLVGRSSYCDYPEEVKSLPELGSSANPDIDAIIKLKPQLLLSQSPIAKKDIVRMESAGIRVLILKAPVDFPELCLCYGDIARLMGGKLSAEEKAQTAAQGLDSCIKELENNQDRSQSFICLLSYELACTPANSFGGRMLSLFGQNSAGDSLSVTEEKLLELNPDFIILAAPMNIELLPESVKELTAVKSGRVILLDDTPLERPTVRVQGTLEYLRQKVAALPKALPEETEAAEEAE